MKKALLVVLILGFVGCSASFDTACEVSPIRSGSTLIYNVLMKMLTQPKVPVHKYHINQPTAWSACIKQRTRCGVVMTMRHPLNSIVSSMLRYNLFVEGNALNLTRLTGQSREYCQWGGVGMLQLPTELPENVLLLRYEDFVDDTLFAIKKIAAFFGLPEEPDRWQKIVSETSRAAVEQQISKFSKFSQMNSKTQYHGRHISPYEGHTDYSQLLTKEQIEYILASESPIKKNGQPTGRYVGEVIKEVIERYGYTV